jgi:hypothetical protein
MNDTDPKIEARFNEMMMRKSGQERLKMGFDMFNMARKQVVASLKMDKSDDTSAVIKREIFLRFYGGDFSPEDQAKILAKIRVVVGSNLKNTLYKK